jgi:hypothetical protein
MYRIYHTLHHRPLWQNDSTDHSSLDRPLIGKGSRIEADKIGKLLRQSRRSRDLVKR